MLEHPSNRIYWVGYGKYFNESQERGSLRSLAPPEFDLRLGENGIRFEVRARSVEPLVETNRLPERLLRRTMTT